MRMPMLTGCFQQSKWRLFLRSILTEERLFCAYFHNEIFPVYGEKCLLLKAIHNYVEKHGKYFADEEEIETEVRK
jgi:hypothetical protein